MMKFESLPNEIFIECFEYLDIFHIFDTFDQLNLRFNQLIRHIPLHIDFQNIRRTKFCRFLHRILSDSNIKQQIYSLRLSNKDTCVQIGGFLFCFSPNELSHLNSLTLINVEQENLIQLKTLLPSITKLSSFHLISPQIDDNEIVSILPLNNLRKLTLLTLRSFLIHIKQTTIITHLTISHCSLEQISYQLFEYVPLLEYFNIKYIKKHNRLINKQDRIIRATHLKKLIIGQINYSLNDFGKFLKQTPNLENLILSSNLNPSMINANHWGLIIINLLRNLKIFKFIFTIKTENLQLNLSRFHRFQSKFWIERHHWNTQFLFDKNLSYIYTIPYVSNIFKFGLRTYRSKNRLINDSNTFSNVTDLTLIHDQIINNSSFYFPNINSLKLIPSIREDTIEIFHFEILQTIVNLSYIKHLDISNYRRIILSGILLKILIHSPLLSSITINPNDLILLYDDNNDELCKYLNKQIKKLNIYQYNHLTFHDLEEVEKFSNIFLNIEELICNINESAHILFLLYRLSNLLILHVYLSTIKNYKQFYSLFAKRTHKLHFTFQLKDINTNSPELLIWIDKKIN